MTINTQDNKYDTNNCDYVLILQQSRDTITGRIQVITNDTKEIDIIIPNKYVETFLKEFNTIKQYSQEFTLPDINNPQPQTTITRNIISSHYVDNYNAKQEIKSIVCKLYDKIAQ